MNKSGILLCMQYWSLLSRVGVFVCWVSSVFLLCSDILNELLQRENRVLHFWTMRKRRLDQCQQYVVFERSAKQVHETHTNTIWLKKTSCCCIVIWQHAFVVCLCMLRLWSGSMTLVSFTCLHTPPPARVSTTHRNCWRSMRTSTSQPRLVSHTLQLITIVFVCVCVYVTHSLFLVLSKPRNV